MKKTYKIEVDCAACAGKMEQAAQKTQGVAAATVSFMTQKMKVEFAEGADVEAVMQQVLKNCKRWRTTARFTFNWRKNPCHCEASPQTGCGNP